MFSFHRFTFPNSTYTACSQATYVAFLVLFCFFTNNMSKTFSQQNNSSAVNKAYRNVLQLNYQFLIQNSTPNWLSIYYVLVINWWKKSTRFSPQEANFHYKGTFTLRETQVLGLGGGAQRTFGNLTLCPMCLNWHWARCRLKHNKHLLKWITEFKKKWE